MHKLIQSTIVLLFLGNSAWPQEAVPDFWPLDVGNLWVYRHVFPGEEISQVDTVALAVLSVEDLAGRNFFRLSNNQLLRRNIDGSIVEYNSRFENIEAQEFVIFDFTQLDDTRYSQVGIHSPYNVFPPTLGRGSASPYPTTRYITEEGHRNVPDFAKRHRIASFGATFGVASGYSVHLAEGIGVVLSEHFGDTAPFTYEYYELIAFRVGSVRYPTAISAPSWGEIKRNLTQRVE